MAARRADAHGGNHAAVSASRMRDAPRDAAKVPAVRTQDGVMSGIRSALAVGLAALLLSTPSVFASGDLFRFSASTDAFVFDLILVGREDPGYVQARWTGKPTDAPARRHHIDMDRARRQLIVYPVRADGQPAFELRVSGTTGELWFDGRRLRGTADWTVW